MANAAVHATGVAPAEVNAGAMLQRFSNQLPLLDATRAGSELYGAPRLNAFKLFQPNESALSRIIEDFFDPSGSHGQGVTFLNVLLAEIGLPEAVPGDPVRTRREVATAERRRIDLVVETPQVVLGIENKPWAGQQPRQLSDYLDALTGWARGREVALIFLSDQEPETAKGEAIALPYASIADGPSLASILGSALKRVKAERTRVHVEEFISYIDWQFGGNEMIPDSDLPYVEAVEAEFGVKENRRSIAAILLSAGKLHARVLDEVGTCVLRTLSELGDDFAAVDDLTMSECLSEKWSSWELRRPSWPTNLSIAFEAGKAGFGDVYFGVRAPDPRDKEVKSYGASCLARSSIDPILRTFGGGSKTKWWPWWKYAATRHWGQEFAAGLVLHSPTGHVHDHPEVAELRSTVLDLARAVDEAVVAR